jgi:hypothetical protein
MVASPLRQVAKVSLIALMALGSLALWIGSPLGWLWIASQLQKDSQEAGFGPYFLVLVGIAVTSVALAKLLARVNTAYGAVSGQPAVVRLRLPWLRSMRGEDEGAAPRTVLDVVMVISVTLGAIALTIWFFFYADSSLIG